MIIGCFLLFIDRLRHKNSFKVIRLNIQMYSAAISFRETIMRFSIKKTVLTVQLQRLINDLKAIHLYICFLWPSQP